MSDENTIKKIIEITREKIKRVNTSALPLNFRSARIKELTAQIDHYEEFLKDENNFKRKIVPAAEPVKKPAPVKKQKPPARKREERGVSEREMRRDFERYLNSCSRIPEHLIEKLKKMPQDRGFIYNRIHLYGYLPRKITSRNHVILTERVDGKIMIHEWISKNRQLDGINGRGEVEYKYYEQRPRYNNNNNKRR